MPQHQRPGLMLRGIGSDWVINESFWRLAIFQPLYNSMIRSFMSSEDPEFANGGSSKAKGSINMVALSRRKAFEPFTYIADYCDPREICI